MEIERMIQDVEKFNIAFGLPVRNKPTIPRNDEITLMDDLMKEEVGETYEALMETEDLVEVADGLGDQLYILLGNIIRCGMQDKIVEVFQEIQRSNMSKLGSDGKPVVRPDGKILKGLNYSKPDIAKILNK